MTYKKFVPGRWKIGQGSLCPPSSSEPNSQHLTDWEARYPAQRERENHSIEMMNSRELDHQILKTHEVFYSQRAITKVLREH